MFCQQQRAAAGAEQPFRLGPLVRAALRAVQPQAAGPTALQASALAVSKYEPPSRLHPATLGTRSGLPKPTPRSEVDLNEDSDDDVLLAEVKGRGRKAPSDVAPDSSGFIPLPLPPALQDEMVTRACASVMFVVVCSRVWGTSGVIVAVSQYELLVFC